MTPLIRTLSTFLLAILWCLPFAGANVVASAAANPNGSDTLRIGTNAPAHVLERAYQAELAHLARQERALTRATAFLDRSEAVIARLKAYGYDTTALEETLLSSRASLDETRTEWIAASEVLSSHAGFDDAGKVTDAEQARTTLETAAQHMQQVHALGREALANLMAAIDEFLQDNPGFAFPRRPSAPPALDQDLS